MRLLTSAAVVLLLAGCSDSKPNFAATDVAKALDQQGLSVAVAGSDDARRFQRVFAQDSGEVVDVVTAHTPMTSYRPSGRIGVGDLVVAGLVYRRASDATCSRTNVIGTCLHKRNVVIVVRKDRVQAARRALAELG